MAKLINHYRVTGVIPLPEGWPAEDHNESDKDILEQKLAFRVDGKPVYTLASETETDKPLFNASKDPEPAKSRRDVEPEIEEPGSVLRQEAIDRGEPDPLSKPKIKAPEAKPTETKTSDSDVPKNDKE